MRRLPFGVALTAALPVAALVLSACGGQASRPPSPLASVGAPETPPIVVPSFSPGATLPMPSGATVTRDPSLLAILPASVAGVPVTEEPQSFPEAATDPAFVASVDRAAFAIAVSGSDLASGVIAHLRPGVYSDKMYTDWRSSYDDGACAQAGGVVAHAEQANGSRTTYVTTCGGGLRVYHAYIASKGVIVSLFSTGPADLGGQLMGAIAG